MRMIKTSHNKAERTTPKKLHHLSNIREWTVLLRTRTVRFCAKTNKQTNRKKLKDCKKFIFLTVI